MLALYEASMNKASIKLLVITKMKFFLNLFIKWSYKSS